MAEVAGISPLRLIRALLPFFAPLLFSLLVITLFPAVVPFVSRLFGFAG